MNVAIEDSYIPSIVEAKWPKFWEENEFFKADAQKALNASEAKKFVMVIPPPNVTGSLHLGHTMMAAIEDSLTRWHRMSGRVALWLPGTDHAGIATQSVVERTLLREEGVSRHDLGREKFIERVMEWKEKYGARILYQLRRLGCSCDWSREAFTMSPIMSEIVTHSFVTLYERGLVYRDERLVSWCPYLETALSEIEVDVDEIEKPERLRIPGFAKTVEVGSLWHFRYRLKNKPTLFIEVATTRLETMLGDVAVAVHPEDPRYRDLVGEELIHPFVPDRKMSIIADEHCDPEFGTGAVKITPAHDKNDYEIGRRHNLEMITIFTLDGKINSQGGQFAGLHRFEARIQVEKALDALNLLGEKTQNPKKMALPRCSRSNDIIEYMLLPQWYINCATMGRRASEAVKNGDLRILPEGSEKQWFYWLDSIRDWCVSRQLWWGHRIPAYLCVDPESSEALKTKDPQTGRDVDVWVMARNMEEAKSKAQDKLGPDVKFCLQQDPDVLDTWFSSGLFPFSTLGWPNINGNDFKAFFPNQVLETGWDILFFWVARMVMLSLELVDSLPFKAVFLHPMVRDAHGKKMSKSSGNVVDPVDVIQGISLEKMSQAILSSNLKENEIKRALDAQKKDFPQGIAECGADALRYGLLAYLRGGRGVNLDINRVIGYKHFCNKLWNATKFAVTYLTAAQSIGFVPNWSKIRISELAWIDRWILHRSSTCAEKTNTAMEHYDFEAAVSTTYAHWLSEFCDVYLELLKPRLGSLFSRSEKGTTDSPVKTLDSFLTLDEDRALQTTFYVMERGLRLLHPFIPFVTEELWQKFILLSHQCKSPTPYAKSICVSEFPLAVRGFTNTEYDDEMEIFMDVVKHFRSMLVAFDVPLKVKLDAFVKCDSSSTAISQFLSRRTDDVATLAKLKSVTIVTDFADNLAKDVINDKLQCAIDPAGSIDFAKVAAKLQKKLVGVTKQLETMEKKFGAVDYESKVPEDIKQRNSEHFVAAKAEKNSLEEALESVHRML